MTKTQRRWLWQKSIPVEKSFPPLGVVIATIPSFFLFFNHSYIYINDSYPSIMKFTAATTALLFAVPSVNAFAPTTVAFRSSSPLFATEAATEEKVGRIRYILSTNDLMYIVETIAVL